MIFYFLLYFDPFRPHGFFESGPDFSGRFSALDKHSGLQGTHKFNFQIIGPIFLLNFLMHVMELKLQPIYLSFLRIFWGLKTSAHPTQKPLRYFRNEGTTFAEKSWFYGSSNFTSNHNRPNMIIKFTNINWFEQFVIWVKVSDQVIVNG